LLVLVGLLILSLLALLGFAGLRHLEAWSHYHHALAALDRRDFAGARTHLDICLEVWPRSASTHFLAARTARRANSLDEALDRLAVCERLGGNAEAVLLEKDLVAVQHHGLYPEVENRLRACLAQDHPDTVLILEVVTDRLMMQYRLTEAQELLDLWLKNQPGDRLALVRRGWVREHLGNLNDAIQAYQAALDADPEWDRGEQDSIRLRLAQLLLQKARPREAARHFEVIRERQPTSPEVLLGLARCRRQLKDPAGARQLLDSLLARHPDDGQALGERGRLALDQGDRRRAEQWLRQAAARCPHDQQILHNLYTCLEAAGKKTEAEPYWARLNQIKADQQRMRGLMKAIMRSPDDAELRYQIGQIFLRNGLMDDGQRWLTSALANNPHHAGAHRALADYYRTSGRPELAAPHLEALQRLGEPVAPTSLRP
jgi:tetratricopeptide (TPR) repeat protein